MKRRLIDKKGIEPFTKEDFEIFIELENMLKPYLKLLIHFVKTKRIPFTIMILKTNISCINEIRENIRKTDLVFKMPIENYYIIILQHTNITTAIQVGSRISSLIKREFMLKKEITYHQMALISVESKVKIKDVIYEILTSIDKNKLDKNEKDLWKKIKKL